MAEKAPTPEKKRSPLETGLKMAGLLVGAVVGLELVKGFFHHN
jgi:hypothetical protein